MQVVYSGGSTCAPYASPRFCRKIYGEPFMPGYSTGSHSTSSQQHAQHIPHHQHHQPHHQSHHQSHLQPHHHHQHHHHHHHQQDEESLRDSIPAMRKGVAVTCLVFNIIVPGLGTLVSGFTVCCGSRVRKKSQTVSSVIRTNCLVAAIQFATTFLFLLGWIWSIMWGVAFLTHSAEYNPDNERKRETSIPQSTRCLPTQDKHSPRAAVSDECIVSLQEPPLTIERSLSDVNHAQPILSCVKPRQQRILRRRMSEQELQTAMLTTDGIEEIILRDYPVHNLNGDVVPVPIPEQPNSSKW